MNEAYRKYKEEIIKEVSQAVLQRGKELQESGIPVDEQLAKVDVLLDVTRFLEHYEENVKVLNAYWLPKTQNSRFRQTREIEPK